MIAPWLRLVAHALVAWVGFTCGTIALVGIVALVAGDQVQRWDEAVLGWLLDIQSPALLELSHVVTDLGKPAAAIPLTVFTLLAFWAAGLRRDSLWLLLSYIGAGSAYLVLLPLFGRPRPDTYEVTGLALPSGHAVATLALALPAAITAWRTWRWKGMPIVIAGAAIVLLVGVTRPYIHYHYVTDVALAWVMTVAWVFVVDRWVLRREENLPRHVTSNGS